MSTVTLTGDDTLTIFDRNIVDFADGDNTAITFPNELVTMKTGKNNNTIYAKNATGNNCDMTIRVIRGSSDDRFLNGLLNDQIRDLVSFATASGTFVKASGDGLGNVINSIYSLSGGVFGKNVDVKENVEGDTEQAISIYTMKFALAVNSIG